MRKTLAFSLVASSLLFGMNIELHEGWNLVGISGNDPNMNVIDKIRDKNISLIVTNDNGRWLKFDPNRSYLQDFSSFMEGKGYWIKAERDVNLTFDYINTLPIPSIQAGWNLVSFGDSFSTADAIAQMNNNGIKVDLIVTNDNGRWLKFDPNRSYLQDFSSLDPTKGYWVKAERLVATATTRDGYDIKIYVDRNNIDVSNLVSIISQYNLNELPNISSQLSVASNLVISTTINGQTIESSYISPESLNESVISSFEQQVQNPQAIQTGVALYVYGLDEGGAPFIISNAKIYRVNPDGTKGDYLGETSQTGYAFLENVQDGEKIWVEKEGFDPIIQTVNVISGGANYIFLTEDNGEGTYEGTAVTDETTARLLNRVLHAWNADIFQARRGEGALITPVNSRLKYGSMLRLKGKHIDSLPDYNTITQILDLNNTNTFILNSLKVYSRKPFSRISLNNSFADLFDVQDGTTVNQIELVLTAHLTDNLKQKLLNNNGDYDPTKIDSFKNNIKVYMYKDLNWTEINSANIHFKVRGVSDFTTLENTFLQRNPDVDFIITVDGSAYTGAYPVFAIYQEPVSQLADHQLVNYNLNVIVKEENGEPISNALVKLTRGNGNFQTVAYTDANGVASFEFRAIQDSTETINLNVMQGDHYPVSRVINISDLSTSTDNNITLSMQRPPAYATIKGTVEDENNNEAVSNAKVKLIYPIALSNVQKDVQKLVNGELEKGISVGLIPNARYKWFIKVHDNTQDTSNVNARVSTQRWVLVQDLTAEDGGNFLPYNKIIALALQAPNPNDPSDVQIVPAGQFDIAVEVDHDIDGDGNYDFTELAATQTPENPLGSSINFDANNNYGRILGYISAVINLQTILQNSGGYNIEPNLYVNVNDTWYKYEDYVESGSDEASFLNQYGIIVDSSDTTSNTDEDTDINVGDKLGVMIRMSQSGNAYILVSDRSSVSSAHDYNSTRWDIGLTATLQNSDGTYTTVALKKDGEDYTWVPLNNATGDLDRNETDKLIFVQEDQFPGINVDKIARVISQNKIFAKLAMPLSQIAEEVNRNGGDINISMLSHPDNSLVEDGFNLHIYPTIKFTMNNNLGNDVAGQVLEMSTDINVALGGESTPLRDYIKIDDVQVNRPVLFNNEQLVHTDTSGAYQFSAVPLSYGVLNSQESLLRVKAEKLGYYDSSVVNVPKFTADDTTTAEREDVKRVNLTVSPKPLYTVDVNVTDSAGNPIDNAIVIMDGIMNNNTDLTESESIKALEGSLVRFENVIGGRGSTRIIKVSVPDSNYIPVIKTIRNLVSNETINITLQTTDQVADFAPSISIISSNINYDSSTAFIKAKIVDKNDGETTVGVSNIYVNVNGDIVPATVTVDANDPTLFNITVPLNPGMNDIIIGASNTRGISESTPIRLNFDISTGSVRGHVSGFTDNDNNSIVDPTEMVVLDIYTNDGVYLDSILADREGNYEIDGLVAGETYKIQAIEYNATQLRMGINNPVRISDLSTVTIQGGRIITNDLQLQSVETQTVSGAPVLDFIYDLTQQPIGNNGEINVSLTISNFDKQNGRLGIVVNNRLYTINNNLLNEDPNNPNSYNLQNYPIQLRLGQNSIYAVAQNPDGSFDSTPTIYVTWIPSEGSDLYTVDINLTAPVSEINSSIVPYENGANVEIMQGDDVIATLDAYDNLVEFNNIPAGEYCIVVNPMDENYLPVRECNVTINGDRIIPIELNVSNPNVELPPLYISGIDFNTTEFIKNQPFEAIANVVNTENGYNIIYNWYYEDSNGNRVELSNCTSNVCDINVSTDGWVNVGVNAYYQEDQNNNANYETQIYVNDINVPMPPEVPDTNLTQE